MWRRRVRGDEVVVVGWFEGLVRHLHYQDQTDQTWIMFLLLLVQHRGCGGDITSLPVFVSMGEICKVPWVISQGQVRQSYGSIPYVVRVSWHWALDTGQVREGF